MRALWAEYVDKGADYKGTQLDTIINIVNDLTSSDTKSVDLRDEFYHLLNDKAPVPLTELLADFGVELKQVASKASSLLEASTNEHNPYLGFMFKEAALGITVTQVLENSPAELTGLSVQDNIIAIDNIVVNKSNFSDVVNNLELEKNYIISYVRNGGLLNSDIQVSTPVNELSQLVLVEERKTRDWMSII